MCSNLLLFKLINHNHEQQLIIIIFLYCRGISKLLASVGHTGRRVVLGHTLNTQTLTKPKISQVSRFTFLCKFTILFWAACIDILGRTQPVGRPLDPPNTVNVPRLTEQEHGCILEILDAHLKDKCKDQTVVEMLHERELRALNEFPGVRNSIRLELKKCCISRH